MKYIHVCHSADMGGITTFVNALIDLNQASGETFHYLLLQNSMDTRDSRSENIDFVALGFKHHGILENVNRTFKCLRDFDGVFCHSMHPYVVAVLIFLGKPVFCFQHGMSVSHGSWATRLALRVWYMIVPMLLRAKVICSSNVAKTKLRQMGIIVSDRRVEVVPFGISMYKEPEKRQQDTPKKDISVGMAGRFVAQKRFDRVFRSFEGYKGTTRFVIRVAGDGPDEYLYRDIVEETKSDLVKVEFLGRVDNMSRFYLGLDLFVLPSGFESFGLVVIEALKYGVPVIMFSDVGAPREFIVHKREGLILNSESELQALWEQLDSDSSVLKKLKIQVLSKDLSAFDIARTRATLDQMFAELL